MTKNDKASGKKDKNFLDDILDSFQEFFTPIISAVESVFESISNAFDSLFSNGSKNKGSGILKAPVDFSGEEGGKEIKNARQSIANLLTLKSSNLEQEEEKGQKQQDAFEKELKNSAKILVNDYVINNQDEIGGFVANDDEEKFTKIKEYFINMYKTQELCSNTKVSDLFDTDLKKEIIGYCKNFLQQSEECILENKVDKIQEAFFRSKFANNEEGADYLKTVNFISLPQLSQETEIKQFIADKGDDNIFDSTYLAQQVLKKIEKEIQDNSNAESSFLAGPVTLEVGAGVSPRSSIELSSNSPLEVGRAGGCGGATFWT